jgi:hypothetical protein
MMLPPWKIWVPAFSRQFRKRRSAAAPHPRIGVKSKPVRQENASSDVAFFSLVRPFSQEYDPLSTSWRAFD